MNHLSEEQLTELYYGRDNAEGAHHLDACSECARAYQALRADLGELKPVDTPARDESYGRRVWESIADRLAPYERQKRPWFLRPLWIGLGAATACTLLIASFYAGRLWEHRQKPQITAVVTHPVPQRVLVVVLSDHLERSERLLVELKHVNANDAELASPLRDEARSLLAANHKCRQQAEKAGDPALTQALDHLDTLLSELANHPGGLNADAIARLQEQMNKDGLLFEVRVLRSRIPDHPPSSSLGAKGGIA